MTYSREEVEAARERLRKMYAEGGHGMGFHESWPIIERHIETQAQEIERLRGLLREHEWCAVMGGRDYCQSCNHERDTHAVDCPMAAALAGEAKP